MKCVFGTIMPIQSKWIYTKWILYICGIAKLWINILQYFCFCFELWQLYVLLYQNSMACFHRKIIVISFYQSVAYHASSYANDAKGPLWFTLWDHKNLLFPLSIATVYRRTCQNYECTISHHCMKCTPYLTSLFIEHIPSINTPPSNGPKLDRTVKQTYFEKSREFWLWFILSLDS